MLNTLFAGVVKHLWLSRELAMNVSYGKIKKSYLDNIANSTSPEKATTESKELIKEWIKEHDKISFLGPLLNYSIVSTGFVVLIAGVLMICII